MALLSRQDVSGASGAAVTPVSAAGGGDTLAGGTGVHLYVNNGGGSSITVTIATPETIDGDLAVGDRAVTVTNGTWKLIPVPGRYNNGSGVAAVTYSGVTSVTVAAILCRSTP